MAYVLSEQGQTVKTPDWLDITRLKKFYLHGVDMRDAKGQDIDVDALAWHINVAVKAFENELQVLFGRRRVVCNAEKRGLTPPTELILGSGVTAPDSGDYDLDEDPYDWHPQDYNQEIAIPLAKTPVFKVNRVTLHVPNGDPVVEYPEQWLHLDRKRGLLRIVPWGTNAALTFPYSGYPLFNMGWARTMPGALWIDYEAGLGTPDLDIQDKIAKYASVMILDVISDAVSAGIANYSVSLDGLSSSIGTTASAAYNIYTPRREAYIKEIVDQGWWKRTKDRLKGPVWTVL